MKPVRLVSLAKRELAEAASYYDSQVEGLGGQFLAVVEGATGHIGELPEASPVWRDGLRRCVLPRFPYSLIYVVRDETVDILAVMHHRRGPSHIARRLREGEGKSG